MLQEDVKNIVIATVDVLLKDDMIKNGDQIMYERMSLQLREHYNTPNRVIAEALDKLKDRRYYDVLRLYYKDNLTLEQIAELYNCDICTITRNKKQLCIKLFKIIN